MIEMELLFADTEELRFASRSLKNFWELCTPRELVGDAKIRIGGNKDGGYVVAKGVQNFPDAISIGIGNDNRSDIFLAKRGVPVFEFDHTVDREPKKHKNVKFHKIGIGLGYVTIENVQLDREIFIEIRDKNIKAKVVKLPFYKK